MRVRFHAIAAGGDAIGRDENNRAVFAARGAPGDVAEVVLTEEHRSFARGRIAHLLEASPQRVDAPCPYYGPDSPGGGAVTCGGCQVQHLAYAAQLEAKQAIVRDALQRLGKIADPRVRPCVPSPLQFGYRNKADFVVGVEQGKPRIGFFARNSHYLIDIEACPLQQEPNNRLLQAVRKCMAEGLATPFDPRTGRGLVRRLVARTASDGTSLLVVVTTAAHWPAARDFAARLRVLVPSLAGVLQREPRQDARLLGGQGWIEEVVALSGGLEGELGELRLRISADGFFQVNTAQTAGLVEAVLGLAEVRPQQRVPSQQRVLDLYCGAGLFALAAASCGARVMGIEANRAAVDDARENARRNSLPAEFMVGARAAALQPLREEQWDTVVLDPPRTGAQEYLPGLLELAPRRIIYVSCDPATLARDIRTLTADRYRLVEAVPLDMFPQTGHVETVARLDRH